MSDDEDEIEMNEDMVQEISRILLKEQEKLKDLLKDNKDILDSIKSLKQTISKHKSNILKYMEDENIEEMNIGQTVFILNKRNKVAHSVDELKKIAPEEDVNSYLQNVSSVNSCLSVRQPKKRKASD